MMFKIECIEKGEFMPEEYSSFHDVVWATANLYRDRLDWGELLIVFPIRPEDRPLKWEVRYKDMRGTGPNYTERLATIWHYPEQKAGG